MWLTRVNEGYRAWGVLKSVLSNGGLGIKAKTNGIVMSRGMTDEKCWEKESECPGDEVFEKFGWSVPKG